MNSIELIQLLDQIELVINKYIYSLQKLIINQFFTSNACWSVLFLVNEINIYIRNQIVFLYQEHATDSFFHK